MFITTNKGVETRKFVEIHEKQKNQPPLQEEVVGNNEHPLHQNKNGEQQEEREE